MSGSSVSYTPQQESGQESHHDNTIERVWRDLKAHHLAHLTFADSDALDRAIHNAVEKMNEERKPLPLADQRIYA